MFYIKCNNLVEIVIRAYTIVSCIHGNRFHLYILCYIINVCSYSTPALYIFFFLNSHSVGIH